MPTNSPSAVEKLRPSRLVDAKQMQLLGGDVDIDDFHLQVRKGVGVDIVDVITDAVIDRTTEGASTLTVTCDDNDERQIQKSGSLGHGVDVNVDGLWWTLTGVKKAGRSVTLVFEEREVNLLRKYNKPIFADRNKVTRAQFVLRMIHEVKEVHLKWVIPELNIKQDVSDISGSQILVDGSGKPLGSAQDLHDSTTAQVERGQGIAPNADLKVRGVGATKEQITNANIILNTAVSLGAPRKVMVASIMVAIDESNIRNLRGGDRDSVGVFQQRPSQGWPASRDVATDAAAFLRAAISLNSQPAYAGVPVAVLCQAVQHSGTPDGSNYAAFQGEANDFVNTFDHAPSSSDLQHMAVSSQANAATSMFMRGQVSKARGMSGAYVLQKENSWNCMQRLANEVNWRAFVVSGVVYYVSEHWLFKSKPFMVISEDSPGVDWIDYDYDEGKHKATLQISAHLSRWSAPPGCTIQIKDMGLVNGKYFVTDVSRSIFNSIATITAEKPLPILPEPVALSGVPQGFGAPPNNAKNTQAQSFGNATGSDLQQQVVAYVRKQLGVPYKWGAEQAGVAFDCSGLAQAAYATVGIPLSHYTVTQYAYGVKLSRKTPLEPGDLVFFGQTASTVEHVGIYIGGGAMIDAPHTGAQVRVDKNFQNWTDPPYYGATRPLARKTR